MERTIEKAEEELDYEVLIPTYIPEGFELKNAVLEESLFIVTYASEDDSRFIELKQNQFVKGLNIERLLEYVENREDPYEEIQGLSYLQIDEFVGVYSDNKQLDALSYEFIPALPKNEVKWYPYYRMNSLRVEQEEFQKVVESLE